MLMRVALSVTLAVMLGCVGPVFGQDIVFKTLTPHTQANVSLTTPPKGNEEGSPPNPPASESLADPNAEEEGSLVVPSKGKEDGISVEGEGTETGKEKFFLKSFRTLSNTEVSLRTSTVFSSCVWAISGTDCMGKRKKRAAISPSVEGLSIVQESSLLDSSRAVAPPVTGNEEEAKFAFTIWTQVSVTTTITTLWTNPSFTISLSYWCSVGFLDVPINRCNG